MGGGKESLPEGKKEGKKERNFPTSSCVCGKVKGGRRMWRDLGGDVLRPWGQILQPLGPNLASPWAKSSKTRIDVGLLLNATFTLNFWPQVRHVWRVTFQGGGGGAVGS